MTPLLAILEFSDYAIIAGIVTIFAGGASFAARQRLDLRRVEHKLDLLLKQQGIVVPSEFEMMVKDPTQKIAAIRLYRQEHPGVGLAEAKAKVEEIYNRNH